MNRVLLAKDFMITNIVTLKPETNIYDAINIFIDNNISGAPVLDDGVVVGILSERDIIQSATIESYYNLPGKTISELMSKSVFSIKSDMDLFSIASIFSSKPFRRLPVIEKNKLIGQISRRDVLKAMRTLSS